MLLDHETGLAGRVGALVGRPARLRRLPEVALGAVGVESVAHRKARGRRYMPDRVGIVRRRMDANPIVLDDTAGDVVVVLVEGEHDIYTAPTLRERLDEALGRGGGIVVDLTRATFVDSSVLGALLDARRRAIEATQGYVVCVGDAVEPGVQRILDITGLVPVLPVIQGRDEAIDAARSTNGAGE